MIKSAHDEFIEKKKDKYTQCIMERKINGVRSVKIAFIPDKFAKEGKYVKLQDEKGNWVDNWRIFAVGCFSMDKDHVLVVESQHKNTRKVSDI